MEGTPGAQIPLQGEPLNEASFLEDLCLFMGNRGTPIDRIPHLGFKRLDLSLMFKTVQDFGGYDKVTALQQWKQVYNMLGGNPRSTSAATCTRRHYEKLILPYERHLKRDKDKVMTSPQPQKRSHHDSFPLEDEEGPRGRKLSAGSRVMYPTLDQRSCGPLLQSGVKSRPKTMYLQPYLDINLPNLPVHLPVSPNIPPQLNPHLHPYFYPQPDPSKVPYSLIHPVMTEGKKQEVKQQGKEHPASLAWEEPLNLSLRKGGVDTVSQPPSSCASVAANKVPKFLNKVCPLYSHWNVTKEQDCELPGGSVTAEAGLIQPDACSSGIQEEPIIDLTSPHDISPANSPNTKSNLSSSPLLGSSLSSLNLLVNKIPGRNFLPPPTREGEEHLKLNPNNFRLDPPIASARQTPLQARLNGLHHRPGTENVQASGGLAKAGENQWLQEGTVEGLPMPRIPSDLSFLGPYPDRRLSLGNWNSILKREMNLIYPFMQEGHLGSQCFLASTNGHLESLTDKFRKLESASKRCRDTAPVPPGIPCGVPDIEDVNRQLFSCWEDPEAISLYHMGRLYSRELQAGRGHPDTQPMSCLRFPSGAALHNQETPQCRLEPTRALELLEGIPPTVTGLNPRGILALRKLISSTAMGEHMESPAAVGDVGTDVTM